MSDSPTIAYESAFRNTPVATIGMLAILAAAAGAIWAAVVFLPSVERLWPILEVVLASAVSIVVLRLAVSGRHRWAVDGDALTVSETKKFSWVWPERAFTIALADIRAVRRVESGFDVMLELETATGARYRLMQGQARDKVGVMLPDKRGLNDFANSLRKRIVAAGATHSSFQDGLGFWNRPAGLAVLVVMLGLTLGLSGLLIYGIASGAHIPQGFAVQGLALVLLLPFAVIYALYRALVRRSFVLGVTALRTTLTTKG